MSSDRCPQGHLYDDWNTYRKPSRGHRECRICLAERAGSGWALDLAWMECPTCKRHLAGCWDFDDDPSDRQAHLRAYHRQHTYAEIEDD